MFGNNFTLFEVLGFRIRANVSWLFLAILITWTLAAGLFPENFPGLPQGVYWSLGIIGMLGLFFSLLFHELAHSVVGRARGMEVTGITLFLFGGVAEMALEPDEPKTEFWMAIAGPVASVLLSAAFFALAFGLEAAAAPPYVVGLVVYLSYLNLLLAAFNMVPGFPLDGGRVLRALLWRFRGDLQWATRWATRCGQGFALLLMAVGALAAIAGNVAAGLWWVLIGLFLNGAATAAYQRLLAQESLKGMKIRDVMSPAPATVPPETTISGLVEDYIFRHDTEVFPVVAGGNLRGCVSLADVRQVPRERWTTASVGEIARDCSNRNLVDAGADAAEALDLMQRTDNGHLLVTDDSRVVGLLTLKDLLHRLSVRRQLAATH